MKTSSKVFAILFAVLGLSSAGAALFLGATHQWAMACICLVMASCLYDDYCVTETKNK